MEEKIVLIISDGKKEKGKLFIFEEDPENPDLVRLELLHNENRIMENGPDFFDVLQKIRRTLERSGMFIFCNGASTNVYPSPLMRNMGGGRKAYQLRVGSQARNTDIVDLFDDNIEIDLGTVSEQDVFYKKWIDSIKK